MRRKLVITVAMVAAMIGVSTNAVLAERGPMPGFGGPPPGMERGAENFEARMAKILKLTDTQKTQIKALLDAERESVEPLREKMHQSREQLKQLAEATVFDEAAVRERAVAQSQIEVELIVSHTRTLNKVNALLTPDQRELLANQPSFTKSADGLTVKDNITGLTWQQNPDTTGDGTIDSKDKMTWTQAQARPTVLNAANYGGYNDWRLPTIKELYSLMNFMGTDVGPGSTAATLTPFIDRNYFSFGFGDTAAGERLLDAQYASSNLYVSKTMMAVQYGVPGDETLFGVNFADGRIKGYGLSNSFGSTGEKTFYVRLVRGAAYGVNDFVDNGDSTISDRATGLMWSKGDSAKGMNWQEALAWAQTKNAENYLGHNDWRLPNAKDLQNIVDYTRSPDTTSSAAINALFTCTGITNEAGNADYPYYWTSTNHILSDGTAAKAVYIAFGRALGYMTSPTDSTKSAWVDAHGAGAQRSDPKVKDLTKTYPYADGPQGDAIRVDNYVRLVRNTQ